MTEKKSIVYRNLYKHNYASARSFFETVEVINSNDVIVAIRCTSYGLRSYNTDVIRVKNNRLVVTGTYSATTRKHISWWLNEYGAGLTYQQIKKCYEENVALDLRIKEYVPLNEEEKNYIATEQHTVRRYW